MDSYKPYTNTLTLYEQEKLKKMYDPAEGEDKKSWNMFFGNMELISWNVRSAFKEAKISERNSYLGKKQFKP